jgi:hypothetical protein
MHENQNITHRKLKSIYFNDRKHFKEVILNEKLENIEILMLHLNDNTQKSEVLIYCQLILILFIVIAIVIHYKLL